MLFCCLIFLGLALKKESSQEGYSTLQPRWHRSSLSGEIPWKVLPSQIEGVDEEFHADVIVQSVSGKEIKLPVLFYATSYGWDKTHVYLHLGDRSGPCLNQYHEDIVRLAKEVHGIDNIGNY